MPELPSLGNLPQAQFDKIVASFAGNAFEKEQAFKDWYINRLLDRVEEWEQRKAQFATHATLPARRPEPGFPPLS